MYLYYLRKLLSLPTHDLAADNDGSFESQREGGRERERETTGCASMTISQSRG